MIPPQLVDHLYNINRAYASGFPFILFFLLFLTAVIRLIG